MPSESPLRALYTSDREAWARAFLAELRRANIRSYVQAPEAAVLPALGRSMDLLVDCVVERQPDRYVQAQRELFAQRIQQGVPVKDILDAMEPARITLEELIRAAYVHAPEQLPAMLQRGQRYLLMTRTTLVSLISEQD